MKNMWEVEEEGMEEGKEEGKRNKEEVGRRKKEEEGGRRRRKRKKKEQTLSYHNFPLILLCPMWSFYSYKAMASTPECISFD